MLSIEQEAKPPLIRNIQCASDSLVRWLRSIQRLLRGERALACLLTMSLVMILLYVTDTRMLTYIVALLVPIALVFQRLAFSPVYWLILSTLMVLAGLQVIHSAENHKFLIVYWCFAITVSLFTKIPRSILAFNARVLIGLCFAFATFWKLLLPEFLSGTFFHFTLLTDERFFGFSEVMACVSSEATQRNIDVYQMLKDPTNRISTGYLESPSRVPQIALLMAIWTIIIEGWIAVAFLSPRGTRLSIWRDVPLVIFMLSTYPIATVKGFATLLAILGFAQCGRENYKMRLVYLSIFLAVPLFTLPFVRIAKKFFSFL